MMTLINKTQSGRIVFHICLYNGIWNFRFTRIIYDCRFLIKYSYMLFISSIKLLFRFHSIQNSPESDWCSLQKVL